MSYHKKLVLCRIPLQRLVREFHVLDNDNNR